MSTTTTTPATDLTDGVTFIQTTLSGEQHHLTVTGRVRMSDGYVVLQYVRDGRQGELWLRKDQTVQALPRS
jgi:hypothetical protein